MSNYVINVQLGRIAEDATDIDTGVLSDEAYGTIFNIRGGAIEYGFTSTKGESGANDNWVWNGTWNFTDLEFESHDAADAIEALGPGTHYIEVGYQYYDGDDPTVVKTRLERYTGKFMRMDPGTYSDQDSDTPRSFAFRPWKKIVGGGENRNEMGLEQAALYADKKHPATLRTRTGGTGASIDWLAAFRTSHGVTRGGSGA